MAYSLEQLESDSAHNYPPQSGIARVVSLFKAEKRDIIVIAIYALAIGMLSLVVPIGVQSLVNTVAFGALLQPVVVLTLLVLVLMGLSGIMSLMQIWFAEILQRRLFVRIAIDLACRIPRFKAAVFRDEIPQDLINRFFEVVIVQKSVAKIFLEGISIVLQAVIGLLILTFYHPFLFIFVFLLLIALFLICAVVGIGAVKTSMKESSAKHTVLIWLENLAEHAFLFKTGFGREYAIARTDQVTSNYLKSRQKHFRILFRQMIGFALLQTIASAFLLGLGGYLVINEQLTLGQLVAAELIVAGVLLSFTKLGKLLESYYDLVASISKLDSLIELPMEVLEGDDLSVEQGKGLSIQFKDVMGGFREKNHVFHGVNFSVSSGERVVICGDNGSGKSLIADLIVKFHEPENGRVTLGKQNVTDLNPVSIREYVKLVRGVEAFRGTIEDNLLMGRKDISKQKIREVLDEVGLAEEIEKLPEGLLTWLREDARPLSSGQARRLMIARALIMSPSLLIIDEILDSLDENVLNDTILPTLLNKNAAWTLLIMTHDIRLARQFSQRYFIENGMLSPLE
jgi:putative ABC transport system ATP-binding protein